MAETTAPYVSKSTFYNIFKNDFGVNRSDKTLPRLRISKYSTHSVCNTCVILNMKLKEAKSESDLRLIKAAINDHRLKFWEARKKSCDSYCTTVTTTITTAVTTTATTAVNNTVTTSVTILLLLL